MKDFWNVIQAAFAAIGGWLGYFLGGCDGLLYALLIFVVIDYITGVMCAVNDKKLSSAVGFRGLCRKVLTFMLVGIAHVLDVHILGQAGVIRTAVIFWALANNGLSIIENSTHLGLPVPEQLKLVLEQLHDRAEKSGNEEPETIIAEIIGEHEASEEKQNGEWKSHMGSVICIHSESLWCRGCDGELPGRVRNEGEQPSG